MTDKVSSREQRIARLASTDEIWDLAIIGGGAVGMGVAVDAASRGYRCVLFEQHDFAKATSSRSTKLIHGGVRYLAQGNIGLVREALRERGKLLSNAPELVKPLRFIVPCYSHRERWYYWAGMKCYDALSGGWKIKSSSQVATNDLLRAVPGLRHQGLRGGVAYSDAQFDDARLVVALAKQFASMGGVPLNYFSVEGLLKANNQLIHGVIVRDQETQESYQVRARAVVNAGGVLSDEVRRMESADAPAMIAPSQGIHLVVDKSFLGGHDAIMIPKTKDGRVLFGIPWLGRVVLGTTDTPVDHASLEPKPLEAEVDYLLQHFTDYFKQSLSRHDVISCFAGLRPLVKPQAETGATSKISREHRVVRSAGGLISILGGKWTTYRKMAEDVVEAAIEFTDLARRESTTNEMPIHLGPGSEANCPEATPTESQVRTMIHEEFARTPEDVLARRFRCLLLDAKGSLHAVRPIAAVMADELGHSPDWAERQVASYERLVAQYTLQDS